jgi:N utilization substance protein B
MRGSRSLELVTEHLWADLAVAADERRIADRLLREVDASRAELDRALEAVTTNWRLERIGGIERCVLRLAAAELRLGETPPRVVIQEAVRMAERFGTGESARFVNGVVDALARRMGRL